jgi:hypothetical protein
MLMFDHWRDGGFAEVARAYLSHLPAPSGFLHQIDARGDLVTRNLAQVGAMTERQKLHVRLLSPSWLDPTSGTVLK